MQRVLTTCPFCSCGCAVYLNEQDGRPVGVAPSEHHPVSGGRLCARGWNAHEAPAWGERLARPMIRRAGTLEPAAWDEAIEAARSGLAAVLAGGRRVGVLGSARATNEENYLAARLARGALGTGNVDSCLRPAYQAAVDGIAAVLGSGPDGTLAAVETSDVVFVLEADIAATHPQAAHAVVRAIKGGARVVTVGSARTQLARLATLHLASRPGERSAVVGGVVAAALRRRGPVQAAGIEAGVAGLATTAAGEEAGRAAGWLAEAGRVTFLIAPEGFGADAALREAAALATLAVLGDRREAAHPGILVLPARGNLRGATEMGVTPDRLAGGADLGDAAAREGLAKAWGRAPALEVGLPAQGMIAGVGGLVVVADDPPSALPDGRGTGDALGGCECLVVLDAFPTATSRAAHVVLPIASFAESDGTVTSAEGRVQRIRAATRPPGDAAPGWLALARLSAALGLPSPYAAAADVTREIAAAVPTYAGIGEGVGDEPWGVFARPSTRRSPEPCPLAETREVVAAPAILALDGVLDWGSDPLVSGSPTLSRDHASRKKLYPRGLVQMSKGDADSLGLRDGWPVRLTSAHGEAVLPAVQRGEIERGVLLVPFAFRDSVASVLAGRSEVAVKAERAR